GRETAARRAVTTGGCCRRGAPASSVLWRPALGGRGELWVVVQVDGAQEDVGGGVDAGRDAHRRRGLGDLEEPGALAHPEQHGGEQTRFGTRRGDARVALA